MAACDLAVVKSDQASTGDEGFVFKASLEVVTILSNAFIVAFSIMALCWFGWVFRRCIQTHQQPVPDNNILPLELMEERQEYTAKVGRDDNGRVIEATTPQKLKSLSFNQSVRSLTPFIQLQEHANKIRIKGATFNYQQSHSSHSMRTRFQTRNRNN